MEPFLSLTGLAAALPMANLDTDQIMPKQFLRGVDRHTGLAEGFLHDLRFSAPGVPRPGFVLNRAPWTQAKILVTGPNYGCGSSREHAVWGMRQLGLQCVIGSSFGGIFADNCTRNGVPAITPGRSTGKRPDGSGSSRTAMPQSSTNTSPNAPTMMFEGLRSRCTTPRAWAKPTVSHTLRKSRSTSVSEVLAATCSSRSPRTSFIT